MIDQNILKKIHDLLKLSARANEHEAAAAYARAQEMLTKYRLTVAQVETEYAPDPIKRGDPLESSTKRIISWKLQLASVLAELNGCFVHTSHRGDYAEIHISGCETDIQLTRYFYDSISTQISWLADTAKFQKMGNGKTWYNNYRLGLLANVTQRLRDAHNKVRAEYKGTTALARMDGQSKIVETEVRKQIKLYNTNRPDPRFSRDAFGAGFSDGEQIQISKGIQNGDSRSPKLT